MAKFKIFKIIYKFLIIETHYFRIIIENLFKKMYNNPIMNELRGLNQLGCAHLSILLP